MERKIAILRGINVGGNRKILMKDLKEMFANLGHTNVTTYIQSGNVIFDSNLDNKVIEIQLQNAIQITFGFDVPVIIRTSQELEIALKTNPFYAKDTDFTKLVLTFLKETPSKAEVKSFEEIDFAPDKFAIIDKNVFIYCEGKYHQSKLTNNFFEKKLKVEATTRNWKTVMKLIELSKA